MRGDSLWVAALHGMHAFPSEYKGYNLTYSIIYAPVRIQYCTPVTPTATFTGYK